jgi:hypothetical protein
MDTPYYNEDNNFDDYEIEIDSDVVNQDYDIADEIQHELEEVELNDTDIEFE